jgi:hypothetical protein
MAVPDVETLRARAAAIPAGVVPTDLDVRFSVSIGGGEAWTLVIRAGHISVEPGIAGDVVVHLDSESARRIAGGLGNAQQAIARDGIRIDGDLDALPAARSIEALGALLGRDHPATPVPSDDDPRRTP